MFLRKIYIYISNLVTSRVYRLELQRWYGGHHWGGRNLSHKKTIESHFARQVQHETHHRAKRIPQNKNIHPRLLRVFFFLYLMVCHRWMIKYETISPYPYQHIWRDSKEVAHSAIRNKTAAKASRTTISDSTGDRRRVMIVFKYCCSVVVVAL